LVARVGKDVGFLSVHQRVACVTSLTLAAVPTTVCTKPESASTPMCAFMPKCHWLPFLVWCISGSRSPLLFLVELGAAISVASTTVPLLSSNPWLPAWR
jgi:hypothetical protein